VTVERLKKFDRTRWQSARFKWCFETFILSSPRASVLHVTMSVITVYMELLEIIWLNLTLVTQCTQETINTHGMLKAAWFLLLLRFL